MSEAAAGAAAKAPASSGASAAVQAESASLSAVLAEREARAARRAALASQAAAASSAERASAKAECASAIVQLTIVAPGPRKDGPDIREAARRGAAYLEKALEDRGLRVLLREARDGAAGPCSMWAVEAEAALVKNVAVGLEDGYFLGRLWDFDVYGRGGSKLDRESAGSAARTCFVCGSPAAICAGRRLHGAEEVARRFSEILERGMAETEKKGDLE